MESKQRKFFKSKQRKFYKGTLWELSDGTVHKEGGPAVEMDDGTKQWWNNGKLHRLDGPAIIRGNGVTDWFINSFRVTDKIHYWAKEFNIDLDNLTDEDKQMIVLYWSNYGK